MTEREALKLALEALEHEASIGNDDAYKLEREAIKEALAQTEQAPMHCYRADAEGNLKRIDIHSAQPEQHQDWCASSTQMLMSMPPKPAPCNCKPKPEYLAFMDTPQRTWVDLTDEEIKALASWWPSYDQMPALMVLAKDIQNSLKGKNT